MENKHFYFMREALKEAKKSFFKKEVPVGAVAVLNDKIIARSHNSVEIEKVFFAHAEFLILKKLNKKFQSYRLNDIIIYTTLEPCVMCTGALIQTRIKKVYYGAFSPRSGFLSKTSLFKKDIKFFQKISFESGLLKEESEFILKKFFFLLRNK
ncbi:nucleoside deaminase ['Camptotheca acuminata' phytoplasma]|uniref:nucleoside deaminase n=1 Tax='Camptotheca acuminata' phytoplasma TaxID=3239192 RepID=UPI00351AAF11